MPQIRPIEIVLVERYLPAAGLLELAAATRIAVGELVASGARLSYLGSTALPSDEICFCAFRSRDPRWVEQVSRLVGGETVSVLAAEHVRGTTDWVPAREPRSSP